jgi:hypothetical protein
MTTRCLSDSPSHGRIQRSCTVQQCMLTYCTRSKLSVCPSVHTKLLQELVTISFPPILNHKLSTNLPRLPNTHSGTQPHTPVKTFTSHPSHMRYIHTTIYGKDNKLLQTTPRLQTVHIRDSQMSQNCRSHLKILRVRRVTRSKFHSENP